MAAFVHVFCRRGSLAGKSLAYIEPAPLPMPQPLRLGRHLEDHFHFCGSDEAMVSRHHAELSFERGELHIVGSDSAHGLYLAQTQERIERTDLLFKLRVTGERLQRDVGASRSPRSPSNRTSS